MRFLTSALVLAVVVVACSLAVVSANTPAVASARPAPESLVHMSEQNLMAALSSLRPQAAPPAATNAATGLTTPGAMDTSLIQNIAVASPDNVGRAAATGEDSTTAGALSDAIYRSAVTATRRAAEQRREREEAEEEEEGTQEDALSFEEEKEMRDVARAHPSAAAPTARRHSKIVVDEEEEEEEEEKEHNSHRSFEEEDAAFQEQASSMHQRAEQEAREHLVAHMSAKERADEEHHKRLAAALYAYNHPPPQFFEHYYSHARFKGKFYDKRVEHHVKAAAAAESPSLFEESATATPAAPAAPQQQQQQQQQGPSQLAAAPQPLKSNVYSDSFNHVLTEVASKATAGVKSAAALALEQRLAMATGARDLLSMLGGQQAQAQTRAYVPPTAEEIARLTAQQQQQTMEVVRRQQLQEMQMRAPEQQQQQQQQPFAQNPMQALLMGGSSEPPMPRFQTVPPQFAGAPQAQAQAQMGAEPQLLEVAVGTGAGVDPINPNPLGTPMAFYPPTPAPPPAPTQIPTSPATVNGVYPNQMNIQPPANYPFGG